MRKDLSQDEVRERMILFCRENGVKDYKFAQRVNLANYTISRWKNKRMSLCLKELSEIDDYLTQQGY